MTTREARKAKGLVGKWSTDSMQQAVKAIQEKKMGLLKASKQFHVPRTTLARHLKGTNKFAKAGIKHSGRKADLPELLEKELVDHILKLESRFYGLRPIDLQKLAFEIAQANNLHTRFNKEKKVAGKEWLQSFMKRHPEISLRTPQPTSLARASGFNKTQVTRFFNIIEEIIDQHNITPNNIWNMDESGLTVVQKVSKILAKKGKHQVGAITSLERGHTITIICCMNAAGNYLPPAMIFPRKRMKPELQDGAPVGTMFACQVDKKYFKFCLALIKF